MWRETQVRWNYTRVTLVWIRHAKRHQSAHASVRSAARSGPHCAIRGSFYHQERLRAGPVHPHIHSHVSAGLPPLLMFSLAHVWTPLLWHVPLHNPVHPLPLPFPNPFHVLLVSWTWIISVSLSRLRIFPSLSSYKNPHLCRWTRFCHGRLRGTDCTRLNVARGD